MHNESNRLSRELASLVETGISINRKWSEEVAEIENWFGKKKPPLDRELAILSGDCSVDDQERMFQEERIRLVAEIDEVKAKISSQIETIKRSMKMSENCFESRETGNRFIAGEYESYDFCRFCF